MINKLDYNRTLNLLQQYIVIIKETLLKMAESDNESFEDIEFTEMEDRPEYQEPVLELSEDGMRQR